MIGLQEILIPLAILGLAALFGKATIMKLIKDGKDIKKEIITDIEVKDIESSDKKDAKPKDNNKKD